MQHFQRRLDSLDRLTATTPPQWWKDFLSLWRPSGHGSGTHGLRLAIRNNYLNFYRKGQSVAAIEIGPDGQPAASLHHKYVDDGATGQEYVTLSADGVVRGKSLHLQYAGVDMLRQWIARAESYATTEKTAVDEIAAANAAVVDLEMGLPGTADRHYAPRMDIVAFQRTPAGAQAVFWEAKMVSDGRIRSRTDPEVLKQLSEYESFVEEDIASGRQAIQGSYKNVAKLLVQLSQIAGNSYPISDLVREVAESATPLGIDPKPRLVVVKDQARRDEEAWERHATKLRDAGVPLRILDHGGPYEL